MKAIVLHGARDLRIEEREAPAAGPGQVRVRVRRAGICGSDMHYYLHGRAGSFALKRPFILGHEFAGEVDAIGSGVETALLGRRVTVDPSMPCGACEYCRTGRYNLCLFMKFFGSASTDPHVDGGFAEYVVAPAANCLVVPETVNWSAAAMAEPLSVTVHALLRAQGVAGKSVVIIGGGAIGQLTALVARAFGARTVVLSDLAEYPRQLALKLGADSVVDAGDTRSVEAAVADAQGGFQIVFEASGAPAAVSAAIALARRGGTIVQIGTLATDVTAPLNLIMARELSYLGTFRFANVFGTALHLLASGRVDVAPLVSATMPLADADRAMQRAVGKDNVIKVQIEP